MSLISLTFFVFNYFKFKKKCQNLNKNFKDDSIITLKNMFFFLLLFFETKKKKGTPNV